MSSPSLKPKIFLTLGSRSTSLRRLKSREHVRIKLFVYERRGSNDQLQLDLLREDQFSHYLLIVSGALDSFPAVDDIHHHFVAYFCDHLWKAFLFEWFQLTRLRFMIERDESTWQSMTFVRAAKASLCVFLMSKGYLQSIPMSKGLSMPFPFQSCYINDKNCHDSSLLHFTYINVPRSLYSTSGDIVVSWLTLFF